MPTLDARQPINWAHPLNNGLVLSWMATPQGSGRAGFGTNYLLDLTANARHGSLTAGPLWGAYQGRHGLRFTAASSQYAEYAAAAITNYPFTIIAGGNPTSASNANPLTAASIGDSTSGNYIRLGVNLSTSARAGFQSSVFGAVESTSSFTANTWVHMAGVAVQSADKRCFLNGSGRGRDTSNTALGFTPNQTAEGRLTRSSPVHYWDGLIDYVAIWNRALTDEEVAAHYLEWVNFFPSTLRWLKRSYYAPSAAVAGTTYESYYYRLLDGGFAGGGN